jgi:predicted Zn finger-like uncharacterized protein
MDLFTRCSYCNTVFRVTTRHLQASGGQVRCGRCEEVFDAFASLTAKPPGQNPRPADDGGQPAVVRPARRKQSEQAEFAGSDPAPEMPEPASTDVAQPDALPADPLREEAGQQGAQSRALESAAVKAEEGWSAPVEFEPDAVADCVPGPQTELEPAPETEPVPEPANVDSATNLYEWEFKPAPNRLARTRLWSGLSVLLLLSVLVQTGFVFRTAILVNVPQAKPVYQQVCRWLSCEIGLPRLADQLNIDASDLQLIDPGKPNLVKLTALVRNRARVAVEYPAFELTLTNAREQVVARRVFVPAEYLAGDVQEDRGLPGRQELAVNLYLDTGALRAAGYRIYLFYPS